MPEKRAPTPFPFSRRFDVETPEHVSLDFELAGLGSRAAAAIYDAVVLAVLLVLLQLGVALLGKLPGVTAGWALAVSFLLGFAIVWGYFLLFEALGGGRTPGKRRVGIRVVMDTGHPVTFSAAATRNLVRWVDMLPGVYAVGIPFVLFHPQHKRLGDLVAGTIVVRDRPGEVRLPTAAAGRPESAPAVAAGHLELSDDEFRLVQQVVERLDTLSEPVRHRLAGELDRRLGPRFPDRHQDPAVFLTELYRDEATKRRGVAAARRGDRPARRGSVADRFVALREAEWEAFRRRASALEEGGIRNTSGRELVAFAGAYREVAADLARARTYGVEPRVLEYLTRVVSTGHNALYGVRGVRRLRLKALLLETLPASLWDARRYVLTAFLVFLIPGLIGFFVVRLDPEAADALLPDHMIARAATGSDQARAGVGYAEMPSPYLPLMASNIIANNVQVAFAAFALGITAGIGTALILVSNGLSIGATLGLFTNYGLAGWLLTFVAAHGVLELTAIFCAGGAGLLIGRALVAPGDLARRDALVVHGLLALRMVGAAAVLLLAAGAIEGFLSASPAPATLKVGVSAASAMLVGVLFLRGRQAATGTGR